MQKHRRFLGLAIALLVVVGLFAVLRPDRLLAVGTGKANNPYQISTCTDLQNIANDLSVNSYYIVTNDIDCSATTGWNGGKGFMPIGLSLNTAETFDGTLDGQGHTISGLYINNSDLSDYVGMFQGVGPQAHILNLNLTSATIISSGNITGGIAGSANAATFSRVQFQGTIAATCNNDIVVGGLVGYSINNTKIIMSSSEGSITQTGVGDACKDLNRYQAGGLVGITTDTTLQDSYADLDITADGSALFSNYIRYLGGLIGYNMSNTTITRSYAAGNLTITGLADSPLSYGVGGIAGAESNSIAISNSFVATPITVPGTCSVSCGFGSKTTGAMVGYTESNISYTASYYDEIASGVASCDNTLSTDCTAVNTIGTPNASYFKNNATNSPLDSWNFTDIWQYTPAALPSFRNPVSNPGPPTNLGGTINSTIAINLNWSAPTSTGSSAIHQYHINYRKVGDTAWVQIATNSDTTNYTIGNLLASTQYEFVVVSQNNDGYFSDPSSPILLTTATPGFHLIRTCTELQAMHDNYNDNYELAQNIDCSATIGWNGGAGFRPVGDILTNELFTGVFAGNNYTISDLYMDQTNSATLSSGLFAGTLGAIIQDVRFNSPHIRGGVYGGTVTGYSGGTTFRNIHVENGLLDGNIAVVGGLVGYNLVSVSGVDEHNEFVGIINIQPGTYPPEAGNDLPESSYYVGGLYGVVGTNTVGTTYSIRNSFAQVDIIDAWNAAYIGGLIGLTPVGSQSHLDISNSYAAGSYTETDPAWTTQAYGGILGVASSDVNATVTINHSFSRMLADTPAEAVGGIVGFDATDTGPGYTPIALAGTFFDADLALTTSCISNTAASCTALSGQPNYFFNTSTNPPLDQWDFTNIWITTSTLPIFGTNVTQAVTTIPPERINPVQPTKAPTPYVGASTPSPSPSPDSSDPARTSTPSLPSVAPIPIPDTANPGIIEQLKDLLGKVPESVLVSFPYILFALLLIGAGVMLLEMLHQSSRLKAINLLLAAQKNIAEERDTFWHLAANYLRAPVTLLMGGADVLMMQQPVPAAATKINALATTIQTNVAGIMQKIEQSKSLQDISWPTLQPGRNVLRQARFWLPLAIVAVLTGLANYVASNFRNLQLSVINYGVQVMVFVLVSIILYWSFNALGLARRKRQQAEEVLAQQTTSLDQARGELIVKTADLLGGDVAALELQLAQIAPEAKGRSALHSGAVRLRRIIDSFQLLISAQTNTLQTLSPANVTTSLQATVHTALSSLQREINAKGIKVQLTGLEQLMVPGSSKLTQQIIGSVLANAVAFSPAQKTIMVSAKSSPQGAQLLIQDQGAGIGKDQLSHLFRPFTKADGYDALQMDHDGLGMNLYLDKLIMDYLGGTISVSSKVGHGTAVTITWPHTTALTHTGSIQPGFVTQPQA